MTREQMVKTKWKPYMTVLYQDHGMKHPAECLLSAIDFDAELLTLTPINDFYEQKEFQANLAYCSIQNKMMIAAIDGKKIKEKETVSNELKARKIGVYIEDEDDLNDAS